jgi:hypothetical protein
MPKTFGGLVGFVFMAVLTVGVGIFIINRVSFLSRIVYGTQKAA